MQEEDRRKITANCSILVGEIDWPRIWPKLLEHGIYLPEDINVQKWQDNLNDKDNNRRIYLGIKRRGPEAFQKFIRCLKEINRNDLANKLICDDSVDQVDNNLSDDPVMEVNGNNNSGSNESIENRENQLQEDEEENQAEGDDDDGSDDYYTKFQWTNKPLKIRVKKSSKFMETSKKRVPCYPMRSNPRGLVLIINNIIFGSLERMRSGAEHDEANLKNLFEQMGFKVEISRNLTREQMLNTIKTFSKHPRLHHVHSMFVIVMSHGREHVIGNQTQTMICGTDDHTITDLEVLEYFTASNCEDMFNKPKIFVFQTCRGEKVQQAIGPSNDISTTMDSDVSKIDKQTNLSTSCTGRNYCDMLVAHSTLPGYASHRDKLNGSWYIQTLCEVFMNHAHDTELYRMLQKTDRRLSDLQTGENGCQTSVTTIFGFNKKCFLNPGYFGN